MMLDSLSLVWGHLVHFAKFLIYSRLLLPPVFIQYQPNFIVSMLVVERNGRKFGTQCTIVHVGYL